MENANPADQQGSLFVCHDCDALQRVPLVPLGHAASCVRCGTRLFRNPRGGIDKPLALILASFILFIIANTHPVMSITILGIVQHATITDAALAFIDSGSPEIALIVWLPSVLFPGITIVGLLYVLLSIRFSLNWPGARTMLAWIGRLLPWGMMDVFLLGILVSLVKLVSLAEVSLDIGFYAFFLLILLYAATLASLEPHILWDRLSGDYERQYESDYG